MELLLLSMIVMGVNSDELTTSRMTNQTENGEEPLIPQRNIKKTCDKPEWIVAVIYLIVFSTGLLANLSTCITLYSIKRRTKKTLYFKKNLVAADVILLSVGLPSTLIYKMRSLIWIIGNKHSIWRNALYIQSVSMTASVMTMTFISLEHWDIICLPLKLNSTTRRAKINIWIIWTTALIFNIPVLVLLTPEKTARLLDMKSCFTTWSPNCDLLWHISNCICFYVIPLLVMNITYIKVFKVLWRLPKIPEQAATVNFAPAAQNQLRSRRKAAKMMMAMVAIFAVLYLPIHLLSILRFTLDMKPCNLNFFGLVAHLMCYVNSTINPVINNCITEKNRRESIQTLCCSANSPNSNQNKDIELATLMPRCKDKQIEGNATLPSPAPKKHRTSPPPTQDKDKANKNKGDKDSADAAKDNLPDENIQQFYAVTQSKKTTASDEVAS